MALAIEVTDSGRLWCISADLYRGWHKVNRTCGYSSECREELLNRKVRIRLQVWPRPASHNSLEGPPIGIGNSGTTEGGIRFERHPDGELELFVPVRLERSKINERLPWILTKTRKLAIYEQQVRFATGPRFSYDLQLLIVFDHEMHEPLRPQWAEKSGFCSGGLPETNRRRH